MRKRLKTKGRLTDEETLLGIHLDELGIRFRRQERFCEREWKIDLYLPDWRIGIEIHGGQFSGGHRRGFWNKKEATRRKVAGKVETPQEDEYLKLSTATMYDIRILQFSNEQVNDGRAKQFIAEQLGL